MSEFPEPQQESAAAFENRDIGPFRKGSKLMTIILFFALCILAKDFKDSISENYFGRVPGPCEFEPSQIMTPKLDFANMQRIKL